MVEGITFSDGLDPAEITQIIVNKFKYSPVIRDMITAERYMQGESDIKNKSRVYYDKDRNAHDNPAASNVKINNNFLQLLVQQKQDYAFSKSFVFRLSGDDKAEVDLTDSDYGLAWKKFLDNNLYKLAYTLCGETVNKGIGWCYIWIDNGELSVRSISPELIYPVWSDRDHTILNKLVYNYQIEHYVGSMNPVIREYAEYWSDSARILYDVNNGYTEVVLQRDSLGDSIQSHMVSGDVGVSWGKIPFICLKASSGERPLLSYIKEYIDSYDMLLSKSIDGLIDDLDPLLVLKGVSSSVADLIEARELAKITRTISLDTDGDAAYIQEQTPIDSYLRQLENIRRDIIRFGYGVDYEDSRFGGNPNQLVVKSLYQSLDTYTDGLERQFQTFIENLKYFFDKWYEFTGQGSFEECQRYKVLVKLDRSMMINVSSLIDDTTKLAGLNLSKKTQLEFNPIVQDVDLELERLKKEEEEAGKDSLFGFEPKNKENVNLNEEVNPENEE